MFSGTHFTNTEYEQMMGEYEKSKYTELKREQKESLIGEILSYCKAYEAIENTDSTSLYDVYYYFGSTQMNPYSVYSVLIEMEKNNTIYIYNRKIILLNIEEERNVEIY